MDNQVLSWTDNTGTPDPCNYILSKKRLGDGSYSTVYECKNKITGKHYAAKMYKKRLVYGLESSLQNEVEVLKKVSMAHPNILTLVDYFESKGSLYLVTELASGGELFNHIVSQPESKLSEAATREITSVLVSAVDYLHCNQVVHRDLKAENILFRSPHNHSDILVADFGSARVLSPESFSLNDVCGTLSYMAPEIFDRERFHGFPVDVWAIGVIVYFMLCGYMPFDCETDDETKEAIQKGDYYYLPAEYWDDISRDAKSFIDLCFAVNADERITTSQLAKHPFICSNTNKASTSFASLKESVKSLHYKQLSVTATTRSPEKSPHKIISSHTSSLHLALHGSLKGAYCESPDQVSQFTTPATSVNVSRRPSLSDLQK